MPRRAAFDRSQSHATRQLTLLSLEGRLLRADLILGYKRFKTEVGLNQSDFFLRPPHDRVRGHT